MPEELDTQQVTLQDYLRILYRGRWIITVAFIAVLSSTIFFTLRATPIYEVATTLMIDTGKSKTGLDMFSFASIGQRETVINNQVEILKSRRLTEDVVEELRKKGYDQTFYLFGAKGSNHNDEPLTLNQIVKALRASVEISPRRDTELINIKVQAPDPTEATVIANTITAVYRRRNLSRSREEIKQLKDFLVEQVNAKEDELRRSEQALRDFQEAHQVVALDTETDQLVEQLADFEARYAEAQTNLGAAQTRLNYLRSQYAQQLGKLHNDMLHVSSPFLEELRGKLAELEATHARFVAKNYSDDHPQLIELQDQIDNIKKKMKEEVQTLIEQGLSVSNPMGYSQGLLEQIYDLTVELEADSSQASAFRSIVDEYTQKLRTLPEKSLQLARLKRNFRMNEKIYLMMKEKLEEAKISEVSEIGNVHIVDPAKEPETPIKPRKKLNVILGALVGLGLGVGVAFLLEYMDTSLKTIEDIEKQVGLPVLTWIPNIRVNGKKKNARSQRKRRHHTGTKGDQDEVMHIEERLITHIDPKSPVSESYRTLRTNIQFAKVDQPPRALLITSATPKEGKSTTVANLSIAMAQMGSNTLLVDTDLRRPVLHAVFEQEREPGLTNLLVDQLEMDTALRTTGIPNLTLLPCGMIPPNPSELLGSDKMKALVDEMRARFDVILFDCPPSIAVTDAAVLAKNVDAIVMVILAGQTNREAALRGKSLLEGIGTKILGVVLNNVDIEGGYGSYYYPYYYYYYYYYYSSEGGRKKRRQRTY